MVYPLTYRRTRSCLDVQPTETNTAMDTFPHHSRGPYLPIYLLAKVDLSPQIHTLSACVGIHGHTRGGGKLIPNPHSQCLRGDSLTHTGWGKTHPKSTLSVLAWGFTDTHGVEENSSQLTRTSALRRTKATLRSCFISYCKRSCPHSQLLRTVSSAFWSVDP